jgi:hypothetical protein
MGGIKMLKLSELPDDVEIGQEEVNCKYTVAELKREIMELGEPHHESAKWFTIKLHRWKPDAEGMLDRYFENENDEMYEGWDDRAKDCVTEDVVDKIQALLDECFKSDHATVYWTFEKEVEIDLRPHQASVTTGPFGLGE